MKTGLPLEGVRVVEFVHMVMGPTCGLVLADLGAEVIKVERRGKGDDSRAYGPPWLKGRDGKDTAESAYFAAANRGKKSITVDISKPEGQNIVRDLAARCDVLLENYKYGDLPRYGLGYDDLKKINPRLIYCSVTGFGHTGPYRERPGYDFMIQGMGGIMSITGVADGEPGGGPVKCGVAFADIFTGLYATIGILAALNHRDRTGEGQFIDVALLDSQVAVLANQALNYLVGGKAPGRLGNAHPNIVPYQTFATLDGHIIIAVGTDRQFRELCAIAGTPELASDARFATNRARVGNRQLLIPLIARAIRERTTQAWIEALEPAAVPCGPINSLDQVFADKQVRHRRLEIDLTRRDGVATPTVANPINLSATPIRYDRPAPKLGEHTAEVLGELLGIDGEHLVELRSQGVIA